MGLPPMAGSWLIGQMVCCAQGPETDPKAIAEIRNAIQNRSETTVRILNYKKSGKPFWNMFTLAPMADVDGMPRFLIGVQVRFLPLAVQLHMQLSRPSFLL